MEVESLFQKNSVQQLHKILEKIQSDATRKTTDLRIMVGERYRDVIDAADAISSMQQSVNTLQSRLDQLEKTCKTVQERKTVSKRVHKPNPQFTIVAEVDVLSSANEFIWRFLDAHQYLDAATLFLLTRLIYGNRDQDNTVHRIWDGVQALEAEIIAKSNTCIESSLTNKDTVVKAIGALVILNPSLDVLSLFFQLRQKYISNWLSQAALNASDCIASISRICNYIINTFSLVDQLFISNRYFESELAKYLQQGKDNSFLRLLLSEKVNIDVLVQFVSPHLLKFVPKVGSLNISTKHMTRFVQDLPKIFHQSRILDRFQHGTELMQVQQQAFEVVVNIELKTQRTLWQETCRHLFQEQKYLWIDLFSLAFFERSKQIIKAAIQLIKQSDALSENESVILHLSNATWHQPDSHSIINHWSQLFFDQVKQCKTQLDPVVSLPSRSSFRIEDPTFFAFERLVVDARSRHQKLLRDLIQQSFVEAVSAYEEQLQAKLAASKKDHMNDQCLAIGRTARSISSGLMKAYVLFEYSNTAEDRDHSQIKRVQEQLDQVYMNAHSVWIEQVASQLQKSLQEDLKQVGLYSNDTSLWEDVTIPNVQFKLPAYPSPYLLQRLQQIATETNRATGYDLEGNVQVQLLVALSKSMVQVYYDFLSNQKSKIGGKGVIQLLYDVKFIQKAVYYSHSKNPHTKDLHTLTTEIKSLIDPIDLAIIEQAVTENIDKYFGRIGSMFGTLLLIPGQKTTEIKKSIQANEAHNLVPLVSTSHIKRFALLPIATPNLVESNAKDAVQEKVQERPKAIIKLSSRTAHSRASSGNTMMGLVNAVTGVSSQQKAAELFSGASNFISGVWKKE